MQTVLKLADIVAHDEAASNIKKDRGFVFGQQHFLFH